MRNKFPLHDATFDGIILSGRSATLVFTTSSGGTSEVSLHEVDALQLDEMREGNITVLFEETRDERPNAHIDMEKLYIPPHPSASEQYHKQYRAFLETKLVAIANGDLSLVVMEPAIGATMLATCKQVSLVAR